MLRVCVLALLLAAVQAAQQFALNTPSMLLPAILESNGGERVKAPLFATGGCFHWETSSEMVVSVEPDVTSACQVGNRHGYTRVLVSSKVLADEIVRERQTVRAEIGSLHASSTDALAQIAASGRRSAWISATDLGSDLRLDCEVFVDVISSIQMLTATRRINVGDVETLEVQAFDIQGSCPFLSSLLIQFAQVTSLHQCTDLHSIGQLAMRADCAS